ncbi:hypothetical protein ACFLUV_03740 [Elusimicrobiota bacterium]
MWKYVKPLGIITYILLLLTVISGKLKWKLKHHRILAIAALIIATVHALIVIFS